MVNCFCRSSSESPSKWRSGCGEDDDEAEEDGEEERRDTPKKDNPVCLFRRRQVQRDWAIAEIAVVYLRKENTLRFRK